MFLYIFQLQIMPARGTITSCKCEIEDLLVGIGGRARFGIVIDSTCHLPKDTKAPSYYCFLPLQLLQLSSAKPSRYHLQTVKHTPTKIIPHPKTNLWSLQLRSSTDNKYMFATRALTMGIAIPASFFFFLMLLSTPPRNLNSWQLQCGYIVPCDFTSAKLSVFLSSLQYDGQTQCANSLHFPNEVKSCLHLSLGRLRNCQNSTSKQKYLKVCPLRASTLIPIAGIVSCMSEDECITNSHIQHEIFNKQNETFCYIIWDWMAKFVYASVPRWKSGELWVRKL